ncbi:MAG: phospholipase [Alphaproteobacteria bacterium CG_4_9_14_3_um_filter_47_13]|nr:MAG: phospholipase [Alphaproteobacteria bacterium CG_4_9_14_3_um_filter_47_13]
MTVELKAYKYDPISKNAPQQLVILLHGLGSDGRDLIELAPLFGQFLPDAVFVSPDAPFPCDMSPMGYQWFSLQERTEETVLAGVQKAAPVLDSFITRQMEIFNIPAAKTALVGFSQGTMMGLYTAPRFPDALAGVLGYSGALIGSGDLATSSDIHKIPVHLIHGDRDDVVPVDRCHQAKTVLEKSGFKVTGEITAGLTHSIDQAGIISGGQFLQRILTK